MPHYYADTSVLVKNYVTELGSTWTRQWVASKSYIVYISDLAIPEVAAAFAILYRTGQLRRRAYEIAWRSFLSDIRRRYIIQPVSTDLAYYAADLTHTHPLKGYDAVHLATALNLQRTLQVSQIALTFVSGDRSLLTAAQTENVPTANPFDYVHLDQPETTQ